MNKLALAALLAITSVAAFGQVSGAPPLNATISFTVTVNKFASMTPPSDLSFTVSDGTDGSIAPVGFPFFTNCPYTVSGAISTAPKDANNATLTGLTLTGTVAGAGVSSSATGGTTQVGSFASVGLSWAGNLSTEAGAYSGGVVTITITSP